MTLDRSRPPQPAPLPKVAFPPFLERTLRNGLSIYIVENHEQPIASVSLYVRAGSILDSSARPGVASVTSEMLMKGTAKRNALQIADEIDFVGGSLHANSSWDATTVSLSILSKHLAVGLELMTDIILNPT